MPTGTQLDFGGGLRAEVRERTDNRGGRLLQFTADTGYVEDAIAANGSAPLPPYITQPLSRVRAGALPDGLRRPGLRRRADGGPALHAGPCWRGSRRRTYPSPASRSTSAWGRSGPFPMKPRRHHRHTYARRARDRVDGGGGNHQQRAGPRRRRRHHIGADIGKRRRRRPPIAPMDGETGLYITPGYRFRVVDALITNFHMPRSTLLVLVSALAGREAIRRAYEEALREEYRFLSFGDAMI